MPPKNTDDATLSNDASVASVDLKNSTAVIVVSAPAGPRRRAGFAFGPEPVDLVEEDLGADPDAVMKLLMADPFLKIVPRFVPLLPAEDPAPSA